MGGATISKEVTVRRIQDDLRSTSYARVIAALQLRSAAISTVQEQHEVADQYIKEALPDLCAEKDGGKYNNIRCATLACRTTSDEKLRSPEHEMNAAFAKAEGIGPSEDVINPLTCTETGGMQYSDILLLMKRQLSSPDPDSTIYFFLPRTELLSMQGALPCFQILAREGKLRGFRMNLAEAVGKKYRGKFAIISHRWTAQGDPDPKAAQANKIREMAEADSSAEYFWIDFPCMPQAWKNNKGVVLEERCHINNAYFGIAIKNVNILYLGGTVWVLLDADYFRRFWCALESFLAFSDATPTGLERSESHIKFGFLGLADKKPENHKIFTDFLRCIVYDVASTSDMLDNLKEDEFTVTNQSDKDEQIKVLGKLEETTKSLLSRS